MGLYEQGCTDSGCGKCVDEGFNPGGGWFEDDEDDAPYFYPSYQVRVKKPKGKKKRAKAAR